MKLHLGLTCFALFFNTIAFGVQHFPMGAYYVSGEEAYPVVTVEGESPVVQIEYRKQEVKAAEVLFSKVPLYAPGFIEILDERVAMDDSKPTNSFSLGYGSDIPRPTFIDIKFKPTQSYSNLYALVISGSPEAMALEDSEGLFMTYTSIGRVSADKKEKIGLKTYYVGSSAASALEMEYAILFFDRGSPILSSIEDRAYEHFRQRRLKAHDEKLTQYLRGNRAADVKQKAYSTFIPYLPRELYDEVGSVKTKVILNISEEGMVEVESFSDLENPSAASFIRSALKDWFFYPKLENGRPVATRTATMIEF